MIGLYFFVVASAMSLHLVPAPRAIQTCRRVTAPVEEAKKVPEFLPVPSPDLNPEDVVRLCMDYLSKNDEPIPNAGLEVCFRFSNDMCRAAVGGSLENFINFANNPTFACLVNCVSYHAKVSSQIPATNTRGALATMLVTAQSPERSTPRTFLWTLQQQRRPPLQGCWLVRECLAVDRAIYQTL